MNRSATSVLLLLLAINTMNFFDRQILGAVGEQVGIEFDLGDGDLGLLSTAFTLLYAAVGLPLGRWADVGNRTHILSIGVFLWSILTAASGMAQSFIQLFIVRLGVGVGEATCAPAATSLIADIVPPQRRGRAMAIFMLGLPLGIGLSFLASSLISQYYGWRMAFYLAFVPGVFLAGLMLFVREPRHHRAASSVPSHGPPGSSFAVLTKPTVWWIIASGALHNFNMYALGAFLSLLLQRYHGLSPLQSGLIAMTAYGLSGIPGLLLGGWLADHVRSKRIDGRLLVGALSITVATPLTYVAFSTSPGNWWPLAVCLALACACMYVYYASVYPTLQEVVEPRYHASAMAFYFFAMYLLGASPGPYLMGMVSDYFAFASAGSAGEGIARAAELLMLYRGEGLRSAMMLVPILNFLLACVLFAGCLTVKRDAVGVAHPANATNT